MAILDGQPALQAGVGEAFYALISVAANWFAR
jgi:hypothetical protein